MTLLDLVITATIIGALVLAIWAKISGQTVIELIRDITEYFREQKENTIEKGEEIIYNE